ncbi:hypothetical protein [Endozoicomonas sp. Mp262]|uniref:hypothetical protein n=1 Tax=Endozoicomonas sp. Mp262 TaxID=2919499 RepID=UPI0021DA0EB6
MFVEVKNGESQTIRNIESIPVEPYEENSGHLACDFANRRHEFYFNCDKKLTAMVLDNPRENNGVIVESYKPIYQWPSNPSVIQIDQIPTLDENEESTFSDHLHTEAEEPEIKHCRLKSHIIKELMNSETYKQAFARLATFVKENNLSTLPHKNHLKMTVIGPIKYGVYDKSTAGFVHTDGEDRSTLLSQSFISQSPTTATAPGFFCKDKVRLPPHIELLLLMGKCEKQFNELKADNEKLITQLSENNLLTRGFANHLTVFSGAPVHIAEDPSCLNNSRNLTTILLELDPEFVKLLKEKDLLSSCLNVLWDGYMGAE